MNSFVLLVNIYISVLVGYLLTRGITIGSLPMFSYCRCYQTVFLSDGTICTPLSSMRVLAAQHPTPYIPVNACYFLFHCHYSGG